MIRAFDSLLEQRGSTRPMSLLRILIAVLVAVELGSVFRLTRSIFPPYQLGLSFAFWTLLPLFLLGVWSRLHARAAARQRPARQPGLSPQERTWLAARSDRQNLREFAQDCAD